MDTGYCYRYFFSEVHRLGERMKAIRIIFLILILASVVFAEEEYYVSSDIDEESFWIRDDSQTITITSESVIRSDDAIRIEADECQRFDDETWICE